MNANAKILKYMNANAEFAYERELNANAKIENARPSMHFHITTFSVNLSSEYLYHRK
jgi:hypothetical protein